MVMSRRSLAAFALALASSAVALNVGGAGVVRAQAPAQTTPTTLGLLENLLNTLLPTTTLPPPPTTPPPASPEQAPPPGQAANPSGNSREAAPDYAIPPEAQRTINSVRRTGDRNTLALLEAISSLTALGLTREEAAVVGMGQFPVAGEAYYSDDWYEPRFNPSFHLHMGTDIFAARGTPVRAPDAGTVQYTGEAVGGLSAYVTAADGTYYYLAHLQGFADNLRTGSKVVAGQVLGFVGSSGNAEGGSPHLHMQVHPKGGAPVNPKPYLDRWQAEAMARIPAVMAGYQLNLPRPFAAAGLLRQFDLGSFGGPTAVAAVDGAQLWAASVRRAGTTVRAAEVGSPTPDGSMSAFVGTLPSGIDRRRAEQLADAVVAGVTSPTLARVLGGA